MKLAVIGLDGASFNLLDKWWGSLPNLRKLYDNGLRAKLRCELPPCTSPNWMCYATGKNPGKLGRYWWHNIDWVNHTSDIGVEPLGDPKFLWDYLPGKIGVAGIPTMDSPIGLNGFMLTGGLAYLSSHPIGAAQIAKWKSLPRGMLNVNRQDTSQEIIEIISNQFKGVLELSRRYNIDFLHLTIFSINLMHHFLWDSKETKAAWEAIDYWVGQYLEICDNIILMSDHGSGPVGRVFNINTWLQEKGFLKLQPDLKYRLFKLGISQQRIAGILSNLGLLNITKKFTKSSMRQSLPDSQEGIRFVGNEHLVDWHNSIAVASGQGLLYTNPYVQDELEVMRLIDALNKEKGVVRNLYHRAEIYKGPYVRQGPEFIIDYEDGIHIPGGFGHKRPFVKPGDWAAENQRYGIFVARGKDITNTGSLGEVSILDLAPTILKMFGIDKPEDMDGKELPMTR